MLVHWQRRPWLKWVMFFSMLAWVAAVSYSYRGGSRIDLLPTGFFVWAAMFGISVGPHVIVSNGVLMLGRSGGVPLYIALGSSEIKRTKWGWRIRYQEGKLKRAFTLVLPEQVGLALERAVASSRVAEPGTVPKTTLEARRVVTLGASRAPRKVVISVVIVVVPIAAAVVMRQPLFLLALAAASLFLDRLMLTPYALLTGDHVWWLHPDKAPKGIPLIQVHSVRSTGVSECSIATRDLDLPVIVVADVEGTMRRRLQARLSGAPQEPLTVATPVPQANVTTRCALCGRPGPEAAQGVYLCDLCAGRTILEARQSGHGLTGKETKPL